MFNKIKNWYSSQTESTKTMLWLAVVLLILILIRWDYISERVVAGFRYYSNK